MATKVEISPAIYRAQNPENPKSFKKVSREEFGTPPTPDPEKVKKKSEKSRERLKINYFLDFSNFLLTFSGSGVRGSQTPLGRFFETFRVFGVLGSVDGGGDLNLSGPVLRAMVFLASQHGQLGAIPPPPFLSVPPCRACEVGVRYHPPPQKGYLSDTCATSYENKANACDTPPLRYYVERVLRDMGGISHWAAKFPHITPN